MAEFTNNNFVSASTNFRGALNNLQTAPEYSLPSGPGAQLRVKRIEDPDFLGPDQPLRGQMVFIATPVVDKYLGTVQTNPRASTYSIFDPDLTTYSPTFQATYTLNRFTYDVAREFLLPRAVGYSAGLINYFFRGTIDLVPDTDPQNPGGSLLQNRSSSSFPVTLSQAADAALLPVWTGRAISPVLTSCSSSLRRTRKLRICCCSNSLKHFLL